MAEQTEKLVEQLKNEETLPEAFEKLAAMGDAAVPALGRALDKPGYDKELIYSVLTAIETDSAYKLLTDRLYKSRDRDEQATLALSLAKDGRGEISTWLTGQLPIRWETGTWWRKPGDADSIFHATILASLISLNLDPAYMNWFVDALDGDNPKLQEAAEFIGETLDEVDFVEEEEDE